MEKRRQEDLEEEFKPVERVWWVGEEEFRQGLLEQVTAKSGARHYGEIVQEAAETQAERLVRASLKRLKWAERDLSMRRKGDPGKVRLAYDLRAKTAMPLVWIAKCLSLQLHCSQRSDILVVKKLWQFSKAPFPSTGINLYGVMSA